MKFYEIRYVDHNDPDGLKVEFFKNQSDADIRVRQIKSERKKYAKEFNKACLDQDTIRPCYSNGTAMITPEDMVDFVWHSLEFNGTPKEKVWKALCYQVWTNNKVKKT